MLEKVPVARAALREGKNMKTKTSVKAGFLVGSVGTGGGGIPIGIKSCPNMICPPPGPVQLPWLP